MAPEVRALELLGDVAKARGDLEATIDWYLEALNRVRETSWDSRRVWLMNRLANAYLDLADLESAEPLVGYLFLGEPQARSLLTQARFAYAKENWSAAVEFAEQAKLLAGAGWEETDEAVLKNYRASGSSASD